VGPPGARFVLTRPARPALRRFVRAVWLIDETARPMTRDAVREHVLPSGEMHLVFRLSDEPLRLFEGLQASERTLGHAIVGGACSSYYMKDVSTPTHSVGIQLWPGACRALFGASAAELAEQHVRLDDLWGASARTARDRLLEARVPERQMEALESILAARLPEVRCLHPAVAQALERFTATSTVREVVEESGYSHRAFVALFREAVGLTPKRYSRVLRFQKVLERLGTEPGISWVMLAFDAGYSDQPHFIREFREFAGVSPGEYRRRYPWAGMTSMHHVPVLLQARGSADPEVNSFQYEPLESTYASVGVRPTEE
jgi:AraC-like DNA-binding protein